MELILEALWLLLELVLELFLGAAEVGVLDGLGDAPRGVWICAGYALIGFGLGALSGWLLPARVLPLPATQGISMVLSPLVSGGAMYAWGAHRRALGRRASSMATFWGGASFAFGCAVGRFFLVG